MSESETVSLTGWSDIGTAPKDGTTVLIADAEHVNEAHYVEDAGERLVSDYPNPYWEKFDNSYWEIHAPDYDWFDPTHWMPMPKRVGQAAEPWVNPDAMSVARTIADEVTFGSYEQNVLTIARYLELDRSKRA